MNNDALNEKRKLEDFELIKRIENGEIKIQNIDNETKVRLIALLKNRSDELVEKIKRIIDDNH